MKPNYLSDELRYALGRIDQLLATLTSLQFSICDAQIDLKKAPADAKRQIQANLAGLESGRELVIKHIEQVIDRFFPWLSEELGAICPEKLHRLLD